MAQELKKPDGSNIYFKGMKVFASVLGGAIKSVSVENRTMTIIGTDESKDRDGDIIRINGWELDNYRKNPVFIWAHNYGSVPLARAEKVVRKRSPEPHMVWHLVYPTKGIYPFADMILDLYGEQIINASSVGFIPTKWVDIPNDPNEMRQMYGREFLKQELLELSGCAVPSNPNALQNALAVINQTGKSLLDGNMDPADVIKWLTGEVVIPKPEREDDILEEIESKTMEIVDETSPVSVQVPASFSVDDSTKDKEEKEEKEETGETTGGKEKETEKQTSVVDETPKFVQELKDLVIDKFKVIEEKITDLSLTVKSIGEVVENISKTQQTLKVNAERQKENGNGIVHSILTEAFEKPTKVVHTSPEKPSLSKESAQELISAIKNLKDIVSQVKI